MSRLNELPLDCRVQRYRKDKYDAIGLLQYVRNYYVMTLFVNQARTTQKSY